MRWDRSNPQLETRRTTRAISTVNQSILFLLAWQLIAVQKACQTPFRPAARTDVVAPRRCGLPGRTDWLWVVGFVAGIVGKGQADRSNVPL